MKFSVELQKRGFCVGYPRRFNLNRCQIASDLLFDVGAKAIEMDPASITCGAFGVEFDNDPRPDEEIIAEIHRALQIACSAPLRVVRLAEWVWDPSNRDAYSEHHRVTKRQKHAELRQWIAEANPTGREAMGR